MCHENILLNLCDNKLALNTAYSDISTQATNTALSIQMSGIIESGSILFHFKLYRNQKPDKQAYQIIPKTV